MTEKNQKKKKIIIAIVILAVVALAALLVWLFFFRGKDKAAADESAYEEEFAEMEEGMETVGLYDRFAGVVESQDSWSVQQNPDAKVKEFLVEEGDEVEVGTELFVYDVEQYQSDKGQAEIDKARIDNELASAKETVEKLEKEKKKASAADQANYTIQIQEQELVVKQKELEAQSKQLEIDKLQANIDNATVKSEIEGVVKSIRNDNLETDMMSEENNALITIVRTGDLRVKGKVNEQNIGSIYVDAPVIIRSRVDDSSWHGTIEKIDTENTESNQNNGYMESEGQSSNYPFYVKLESSEGLMMGQHVYIELDAEADLMMPDDGSFDEEAMPDDGIPEEETDVATEEAVG